MGGLEVEKRVSGEGGDGVRQIDRFRWLVCFGGSIAALDVQDDVVYSICVHCVWSAEMMRAPSGKRNRTRAMNVEGAAR